MTCHTSHCVKYSVSTFSTILLLRGVPNFSNNPEGGLPKKMNAIRSGSRFFFVSKAISPPPSPSDLNNDRSLGSIRRKIQKQRNGPSQIKRWHVSGQHYPLWLEQCTDTAWVLPKMIRRSLAWFSML